LAQAIFAQRCARSSQFIRQRPPCRSSAGRQQPALVGEETPKAIVMAKAKRMPSAPQANVKGAKRAQRQQGSGGTKRKAMPATMVTGVKAARNPTQGRCAAAGAGVVLGELFSDGTVVEALSEVLGLPQDAVFCMMSSWTKPILKVPVPGIGGKVPSKARLEVAKRITLRFLDDEERLGVESDVVKAFYVATGEPQLDFNWAEAKRRVRCARLDRRRAIDEWDGCLAMNSGDTVSTCEIFVCGTRPVTLRALVSLLCHESLHNLARRTRRGNPYVSEDTEHIAMALLGDPQLSA